MKNKTINTIKKLKAENKIISAITAYDYSTAKLLEQADVDIILVGDSLGMVALGYDTTHQVSMEEMLIFTRAVARGAKNSLIVADMPFLSYHANISDATLNAGKFIQAGAKAVKLEGGSNYIIEAVKHLTSVGIPTMAHLGFTPQFLHSLGGYTIQGKQLEGAKQILRDAQKLEQAGAFAVVLEMMPEDSAKYITENLNIPTIGIGAGRYCSGQVIVSDDLLGKYSDFTPKFARKYVDLSTIMLNAFKQYKQDVENKAFPDENEIFTLVKEEEEKFKNEGIIKH